MTGHTDLRESSNRRMERKMTVIFVVAFLSFLSILSFNNYITSISATTTKQQQQQQTYISIPKEQQHDNGATCLNLGFQEDMDNLLSKYKKVWIVMPAKAAGSSFKEFTLDCMSSVGTTSFAHQDNPFSVPERSELALLGQSNMPSLIASHLLQSKDFCNVIKHATIKDTLVVYSHREETSRLISSIRHVVTDRLCKQARDNKQRWGGQEVQGVSIVDNECRVEEGALINVIKKKQVEIGIGNTQLLTCKLYDCIVDSNPNIVFMHYKQASQLQKLLVKHHCPSKAVENSVKTANVGSNKRAVSVVLQQGKNKGGSTISNSREEVVLLDEWLSAKESMLEMALSLKENASCLATTQDIEHELFACPNEAMQVSGRSYNDERIRFPFSNR